MFQKGGSGQPVGGIHQKTWKHLIRFAIRHAEPEQTLRKRGNRARASGGGGSNGGGRERARRRNESVIRAIMLGLADLRS